MTNKDIYSIATASSMYRNAMTICCGSSGGKGGAGRDANGEWQYGAGGNGGTGGGSVIILCDTLNFTSGEIITNGGTGVVGTTSTSGTRGGGEEEAEAEPLVWC